MEITDVHIIAGYGSSETLRDKKRLAITYTGEPWKWSKKVGVCNSKYNKYEIHWYEYDGKQYEPKLKGEPKK